MNWSIILPAVIFCAATGLAQNPSLQPAGRTHPFRVTVSASPQPTVLEASTNLVHWVGIRTNAASTAPITVTDSQSAAFPRRFYRVQTVVAPLADLTQMPNGVFMP